MVPRISLFAVLLLWSPVLGQTLPETGNELLAVLERVKHHSPDNLMTDSELAAYTWAMGYIYGVFDLWRSYPPDAACVPKGVVTGAQVQDIVIKYLKENPAKRHLRSSGLVVLAVTEAWACGEG